MSRSVSQFRLVFKQLLRHFSLNDMRYNLYSLRRGGCTAFFFSSGSLDLTVEVGRWADSATARIYIQNVAAESAEISLAETQLQSLRACARALQNSKVA